MNKRAKALFDPKEFSRQGGRGKNEIKISEGSNRFLAGTSRGRGLLHPTRQVSLTVISEQRKEVVIAILGPGHFFGV